MKVETKVYWSEGDLEMFLLNVSYNKYFCIGDNAPFSLLLFLLSSDSWKNHVVNRRKGETRKVENIWHNCIQYYAVTSALALLLFCIIPLSLEYSKFWGLGKYFFKTEYMKEITTECILMNTNMQYKRHLITTFCLIEFNS